MQKRANNAPGNVPGIESITIESVRMLEGPNIYAYRPVMVVLIDIGPFEAWPSDRLPGLVTGLLALMPSILTHRCGIDEPGGFVERMRSGTWIGHIIEHLTLELESLAGMSVSYGNTRSVRGRTGVYRMVIAYNDSEAARYCLELAIRVIGAVLSGDTLQLDEELAKVRAIVARNALGPSTAAIVRAARRRSIPWLELGEGVVQLGYGAAGQRISAAETPDTSSVAIELARDKERAKRLLAAAGIPVPAGRLVQTASEARQAAAVLLADGARAVVVKPERGHLGIGVTLNLRESEQIDAAFVAAQEADPEGKVLIETEVEGRDYRLLVVDETLVAASERQRPAITGDGTLSIRNFIAILNADPQRGNDAHSPLAPIIINAELERTLVQQSFRLDSIPAAGQKVILQAAPSIQNGGIPCDATEKVHPANAALAIRAARLMALPVAGVDMIVDDISRPLETANGVVLEVNARPGLSMHLNPALGRARDVARPIIDKLFPHSRHPVRALDYGRIPLVAITGSRATQQTAEILTRICDTADGSIALATGAGYWMDGRLLAAGDASIPERQFAILADPATGTAILEVGRAGILWHGLAFDRPQVGIITSLQGKLQPDEIAYAHEYVDIARVVVDGIDEKDWAVLNGDELEAHELRADLEAQIIFFATMGTSIAMQAHLAGSGRAVIYDAVTAAVMLVEGQTRQATFAVDLETQGKATILATLAAIAGAWAMGYTADIIEQGLQNRHTI